LRNHDSFICPIGKEFDHKNIPDVFDKSISEEKDEIGTVVNEEWKSIFLFGFEFKPNLKKDQDYEKQIQEKKNHSLNISSIVIPSKLTIKVHPYFMSYLFAFFHLWYFGPKSNV
jgi:predicted Holliday junction resolvase-like endonuclease